MLLLIKLCTIQLEHPTVMCTVTTYKYQYNQYASKVLYSWPWANSELLAHELEVPCFRPCGKIDERKLHMYSSEDGHGHWGPVWDSIYLWSSLSCGVCNRYNSAIANFPVHGKGGVLFCVIYSIQVHGTWTANWCGVARRTKTYRMAGNFGGEFILADWRF